MDLFLNKYLLGIIGYNDVIVSFPIIGFISVSMDLDQNFAGI